MSIDPAKRVLRVASDAAAVADDDDDGDDADSSLFEALEVVVVEGFSPNILSTWA